MAVDNFFSSVVLLLHCDGPNTSTSFPDISGHTATANGNAQISTANSKFGNSSALFDGVGDWIQFPDSVDWTIGTGDFTFELFVKSAGNGAYDQIAGQRDAAGTDLAPFTLCRNNLANTVLLGYRASGGGTVSIASTTAVFDNLWHHLAIVRNGTSYKLYIDGVADNSLTLPSGYSFYDSADVFSIGRAGAYNGQYFAGNIDEVRFTKGVARYTANFTPPTAPFPNGFDQYWSATKLYLPMDGADLSTTFTDVAGGHAFTPTAGATISVTQSKWGGSSASFNAAGATITSGSSADWDILAGDLTVEFWAYYAVSTGNQTFFEVYVDTNNRWNIGLVSNIQFYSALAGAGSAKITAVAPANNTWHHIALAKSGTTFTLYVDGTSVGTSTTTSYHTGNSSISIGRSGGGGGSDYTGYIDDFRITKGVARYTANFTPPIGPFPVDGPQSSGFYARSLTQSPSGATLIGAPVTSGFVPVIQLNL